MPRGTNHRLSIAWVAVVALTLVSLVIDDTTEHGGRVEASVVATVLAIGLSLVKLRVILREFMDVRHAPRVLRTVTDMLVAVMGVSLLATYVIGRAVA